MDNNLKVIYVTLILVIASILALSLIFASGTVVKGTNAGLLSESPTDDPAGTAISMNDIALAVKDETSADTVKIVEIGWWSDAATEETNYEVAIYDHDSDFDRPKDIIGSDLVNAKGTTAGWKKVTGLNISVSGSTIYWIGIQIDGTTTTTESDYSAATAERYAYLSSVATLPDPWPTAGASNFYWAIYAVYEEEVPTDTCTCAGLNQDWEIDMSDYCNITSACDLGTGTLSFTGAGWCNCNASVDTTNLGDPGASGVLYIQDSCLITID